MLERIEESADLVIVTKAAIAFYLVHLQSQVAKCEQQIKGLPEIHKEVEALLNQGNRTELEIQVLEQQQGTIEAEFEPLKPYTNIVQKIELLELEIRKKEKLCKQKEEAIQKEAERPESGEGKFVKEESRSMTATWEHEKLLLDIDISRLGVDRNYQLRRLHELNISREQIKTKEEDIRARVQKAADMVEQKREIVDSVGKMILQHKETIERAKPADVQLRAYKRDLEYLETVAQIMSGVSLAAEALFEQATEPVSIE